MYQESAVYQVFLARMIRSLMYEWQYPGSYGQQPERVKSTTNKEQDAYAQRGIVGENTRPLALYRESTVKGATENFCLLALFTVKAP